MVPYAASDSRWTLELFSLLGGFLDDASARIYQTERALIPILADMEYRGARVDRSFLERAGTDYAQAVDAARQDAYRAASRDDFDLDSSAQLIPVLRAAGLPLREKTAGGRPSLTKASLERLAKHSALARAIVAYRKASKLKGTYVDSLLAKLDEGDHVHCSFRAHGTRTGRLSSNGPNLQNIPPAMREAFIPPDGQILAMLDYSQVELRLAAHYSRDPVMLDAFSRGDDIHARTAIEVFGASSDADETKRRRKIAKNLNFAICYGAGPEKIAAMSGEPVEMARAHLDRFYRVFSQLARWKREVVLRARATGLVQNLYGRKRWLPILTDPTQRDTKPYWKAERVAVNTLIQGSAADMFKETMVNVDGLLGARGAKTRMVLNVHDELVFYVPMDELDLVAEIQRVMENPSIADRLLVPLVVDVSHSSKNWKEKQSGVPT
jgi:DNA polymerase-1